MLLRMIQWWRIRKLRRMIDAINAETIRRGPAIGIEKEFAEWLTRLQQSKRKRG